MIPTPDKVRSEYLDPIKYMDQTDYKSRRRRIVRRAQIALAIGLAILFSTPILIATGVYPSAPDQYGTSTASKGDFSLLMVSIVLPLYGLYKLMTINSRIKKDRRVELLWLYPGLKSEDNIIAQEKDSPLPKIIIISIVSALVLVGLFFWIKSIVELPSK